MPSDPPEEKGKPGRDRRPKTPPPDPIAGSGQISASGRSSQDDRLQVQTAHRHALESMRTLREERRNDRAQVLAFSVAVLGIIVSGLLAYFHGDRVIGTAIAVAAIGGAPAATILARVLDRIASKTPPPSGTP